MKILKVANVNNHKDYNFKRSLAEMLEDNRDNGIHEDNYILLSNKLEEVINVVNYLGDDNIGKQLLVEIVNLIQDYSINFHKATIFYNELKKFKSYLKNHTPSFDVGVDVTIGLIDVVKMNDKKYCPHGCCK